MFCKRFKILRSIDKKYLISGAITVFLFDFFGLFAKLFEKDYNTSFRYPYEGNISSFVSNIQQGLQPEVQPINVYNYNYIHSNFRKCSSGKNPRLVYIIKSSTENFERRDAIRRTWGYENRFSDVKIYRFFILGLIDNSNVLSQIDKENNKYKDIVQLDFVDTYYNNTIKTMSALKWIVEFCSTSRFYFFSDDDMYVSTKNVLRFLRNPTKYPDYIQLPSSILENYDPKSDITLKSNSHKKFDISVKHPYSYDLPENITLYAGFVFLSSPHRHKSSVWYVSLKEYPYNQWPPYVTAGAYVLSREAVYKLYYTSFYTKHFRFDDIYLGLVAQKAGIQLFHCDHIYFYKKKYNVFNYKYVISSHGYSNVEELEKVWNEQKEAGNA